jgi:hypothetical protein
MYGAFPHVTLWLAQSSDVMVVASADPLTVDVDRLRRLTTAEPFRSALARVWLVSDVEGVLAHLVASDEASSKLANAVGIAENTDDLNSLEYAFARSVGTRNASLSAQLMSLAAESRENRPVLSGASAATVDWDRVAELRPRLWLASENQPPHLSMPTAKAARRARAVSHACNARAAEGYREWLEQDDQTPHDHVERLLVALGLSHARDPRGLELADELARASFDIEAELVRATFATTNENFGGAMDHVERALYALRKQPFPLCSAGQQVIAMSRQLAGKDPSLAARAARALLAGPFAARLFEDARLASAQAIAEVASDPVLCLAALRQERSPPRWEEQALKFRKNCLTLAKDPLASEAARDLFRFQMAMPATFSEAFAR